jgi:hypothetical protein
MGFSSIGNLLSREFALGNISYISREFGMISSRERPEMSLRDASMEVMMRTCLLSVRQGRENERVLARRETMIEYHHNQGRRRT